MALFNKNRENVVVTQDELEEIRLKVLSAYALAEVLDAEVLSPAGDEESLRGGLARDFACYVACLTSVDGVVDQKEIDVINAALGTDYDAAACEALIEGKDPAMCTRSIPPSFVLIGEYRDVKVANVIADLAIDVFDSLGIAVATADGNAEKEELWEVNGFVALLRRYVRWV